MQITHRKVVLGHTPIFCKKLQKRFFPKWWRQPSWIYVRMKSHNEIMSKLSFCFVLYILCTIS